MTKNVTKLYEAYHPGDGTTKYRFIGCVRYTRFRSLTRGRKQALKSGIDIAVLFNGERPYNGYRILPNGQYEIYNRSTQERYTLPYGAVYYPTPDITPESPEEYLY